MKTTQREFIETVYKPSAVHDPNSSLSSQGDLLQSQRRGNAEQSTPTTRAGPIALASFHAFGLGGVSSNGLGLLKQHTQGTGETVQTGFVLV